MPAVRFAVVRARRWGRKLPDRELSSQEPVVGEIETFTQNDEHLRRPVRIAKLTSTVDARRPELVPSLYDADVISVGSTGMTITGIERLTSDKGMTEVAQSWFVRFLV